MSNLSYQHKELRADAVLTNSYVSSSVVRGLDDNLDLTWENQVILYIKFTKWSLSSMELKIEFSPDDINYYRESSVDIVSGTGTVNAFEYTFTSDGNYRLAIPIKDKYMKVSVKGTGTVTSSNCGIVNITWTA